MQKYFPNQQLLEKAAKSETGGFSGWYYNYLASNTGAPPLTDNKETDKSPDSDDDSEEDESEIITLNDDPVDTVDTVDTVDSTSQDVDMIITERTAQAGDGSDLDSVEESVGSVEVGDANMHDIFRSVDGEGGFNRQVVVAHVLPR